MGDFNQRRRVAELKRFADDCAKLHAAALVALVSIAQGTPQPETTRRPSWLRLARQRTNFPARRLSHKVRRPADEDQHARRRRTSNTSTWR